MKILFFGDIVGKAGRIGIKKILPQLQEQYQPDLIIANSENIAHGAGITPKSIEEMRLAGIDFFTGGNHSWDKPIGETLLQDLSVPVLRPYNYGPSKSGRGYAIAEKNGKKTLIISVEGTVFMAEKPQNPFDAVDEILAKFPGEKFDAIFVDHHAEATSEKYALGHYLDGRASVVVGTHTHTPTADAQILPKGTAYITDVGFNGAFNSIIGFTIDSAVKICQGKTGMKIIVDENSPAIVNAVIVEIGSDAKALNIQHLRHIVEFKQA